MKKFIQKGFATVDSPYTESGDKRSILNKLLLGLTPAEYLLQAVRNPFNWFLGLVFAIGFPILIGRFIFGLAWATGGSCDYPWGLFLGFGLFAMVPLSSSGFQLGTACEIFGRHDLEPIERLALLNGLLGYFFAVMYLLVDLGQPWRLPYPMVVSFGPAAVLFLVAWHVSTYLSVQILEVSQSFFEWIGIPAGKRAVRRIVLGLTVSGIILSTLHQGALGALFTYAPGKVHPLWYSSSFQWLHFFVSSLPGGLCMVITVSTIAAKTMGWRGDKNFHANLDKVTVSLAKGACMGIATYITIKLIAIAHDNKWSYLDSGWGQWFMFEIILGFMLPLVLMTYGAHTRKMRFVRTGAFMTVLGVVLNRVNTAMITFNWKLPEREIPPWREMVISLTIFCVYIVVYRFILYRLPILYQWRQQEEAVPAVETVPSQAAVGMREPSSVPVASYSSMTKLD